MTGSPSRGASDTTPPEWAGEIRAVVFDMDGLLLDTERLAMRGLHRAGADVGIDVPMDLCHLMIGVPVDACRALLVERFGAGVPADAFFEASSRQLEAQVEAGLLQLKPGVDALLERLDKAELPYAVATSSARAKALRHLHATGIAARFRAIVSRDDVARGKPHPDVFLRAAAALGTEPRHCLALEDSYNGVRAAHAAGMHVVMVPDLLTPTDEMHRLCHVVVRTLDDVAAWFPEH